VNVNGLKSRSVSRRPSVCSSVAGLDDLDPSWRVWRLSRLRDRRRSSVVSLSGEDHGVNTIGNISRSVSSRNVASGWEKIRMVTGKSYISESRSSDNRLKLLEDHVTKHSMKSKPHSFCLVCKKILEGK